MSALDTGEDDAPTPEEIIAMFPDQIEAVLEKAEANDRHAFAAAIREAREVAREEVDHVKT